MLVEMTEEEFELVKKILSEDTDDWDEADLGVDSYADRKNVMQKHNIGKAAGWHPRDLYQKTNHASYAGGQAAEDKVLDALKAKFDEVNVNESRVYGIVGKIVYDGVSIPFKLGSYYRFASPWEKDNTSQFKTYSNFVELDVDHEALVIKIDTNKQSEIDNAVEEAMDYIANRV